MKERSVRRPPSLLLLLAVATAATVSCRSWLGIHSASKADREKIQQLVGPVDLRGMPLKHALESIVRDAPLPVRIDLCESLQDTPVTLVTTMPEQLGVLVAGASMQVGAPFRLFLGHHGEVARPTVFCPGRSGTLVTIEKSAAVRRVP
jgi:hypothetical protein